MFRDVPAFSSFSVDDVPTARRFYEETLGLEVGEVPEMGLLELRLATGGRVVVYPKGADHRPATFTVLSFPVDDVEAAVDALAARGVELLRYDGFDQDERGIARGPGPDIAWFADPAGNVLAVLSAVEL